MKTNINKLSEIAVARIVEYVEFDSRGTSTNFTKHIVNGSERKDFCGLAICQYDGEEGYYLFYCDSNWNDVTDTWHANIESAKNQASSEFDNVISKWKKK
jgi:hypothetical protein